MVESLFYNLAMQPQTINHPVTDVQLSAHEENEHEVHSVRRKNLQPVRIYADDEEKCMLYLYALTIIVPLFVALFIVVFAIPHAMQHVDNNDTLKGENSPLCRGYLQKSAVDPNHLTCFSSFRTNSTNSPGMYIRGISNLNQFLVFYLDLAPYATRQDSYLSDFSEDLIFQLWQAEYEQINNKIRADKLLFQGTLSGVRSFLSLKRNRVFLAVESKISSEDQFFWSVTFKANSVILSTNDFYLHTETVKSSFTIYTILLRVFFFLISLAVFIRYTSLLLQIPKIKVSIEQRYVHVLSALTLTFNDQLYFITVLWPNSITSFISAIFLWNFFFGLFVLWSSFLVRIYHEQPDTHSIETKRPFRVVPYVVFYLCGFAFSTAFAIIQSDQHPILSPHSVDNGFFKFLLVMTIIGFILVIIYIFYLFLCVQLEKNLLPYRHQVFLKFSTLFFIAIVIVVALGSLDVFSYSSGLIMFSFAISNLYSYLLQYLYSPTKEQLNKFSNHESDDLPNGQLFFQEELEDREYVQIDLTLLENRSQPSHVSEKVLERKSDLNSSSSSGSVRQRMRKNRKQGQPEDKIQQEGKGISGTMDKIVKEEEQEEKDKNKEEFDQAFSMDQKDYH